MAKAGRIVSQRPATISDKEPCHCHSDDHDDHDHADFDDYDDHDDGGIDNRAQG